MRFISENGDIAQIQASDLNGNILQWLGDINQRIQQKPATNRVWQNRQI